MAKPITMDEMLERVGSDAGHVAWARSVLERAAESGLALDAQGNLIDAAR